MSSSRPFASARAVALFAVVATLVGAPAAGAAENQPWKLSAELRGTLADAERALILGERR